MHFQVKNLIEKPENDHLPLIEASRLVITYVLFLFDPLGSFKWELETVDRPERLKQTSCKMVRSWYSALVLLGMTMHMVKKHYSLYRFRGMIWPKWSMYDKF